MAATMTSARAAIAGQRVAEQILLPGCFSVAESLERSSNHFASPSPFDSGGRSSQSPDDPREGGRWV